MYVPPSPSNVAGPKLLRAPNNVAPLAPGKEFPNSVAPLGLERVCPLLVASATLLRRGFFCVYARVRY